MSKLRCSSCLHNKICSLWREKQGLDADCYSTSGEGCDFADFIVKEDPRFRSAVRKLRRLYTRAKGVSGIHDPVAYAFYHTWKSIEQERIKKEEKSGQT